MTNKLEPLTVEEIHVLQSYIFNLCMEKDIRQPHELLARLLAHHAALEKVAEEAVKSFGNGGKLLQALRAAGYAVESQDA